MWNREKFETEYQLQFDEINKLVSNEFENADADAMADLIESLLIIAYKLGKKNTNEMLDFYDEMDDIDDLAAALGKTYDGLGYEDRIMQYMATGDLNAIRKVLDTEYHRMFNQGASDQARRIASLASEDPLSPEVSAEGEELDIRGAESRRNGLCKTWLTMLDERVRPAHGDLEGVTIPVTEQFAAFGYDGAIHKADFPSGFDVPELNVNCRCYLAFHNADTEFVHRAVNGTEQIFN